MHEDLEIAREFVLVLRTSYIFTWYPTLDILTERHEADGHRQKLKFKSGIEQPVRLCLYVCLHTLNARAEKRA